MSDNVEMKEIPINRPSVFVQREGDATVVATAGVLRPLATFLTVTVCALIVAGVVANVVIYHVAPDPNHPLARLFYRIDLGFEPSLSAWCSSLGLLACACCLAFIASLERHSRYHRHWLFLAVLFLILAVDESVMLHELIDRPLHAIWRPGGIFYFVWVIPAIAFVVALAVAYARFLHSLNTQTRTKFIVSAIVFVAGAIGMEMVAGQIFETSGSAEAAVATYQHTFAQAIEEGLEMTGVSLFLYALIEHLTMRVPEIRFSTAA